MVHYCAHVHANGERCGSPAMRDSDMCYWHNEVRHRIRDREFHVGGFDKRPCYGLDIPVLEDAEGMQITIQHVLNALIDRRLDERRAGLVLYGIQIAQANLRSLRLTPRSRRQVRSSAEAATAARDMAFPPDHISRIPRGTRTEKDIDNASAEADAADAEAARNRKLAARAEAEADARKSRRRFRKKKSDAEAP